MGQEELNQLTNLWKGIDFSCKEHYSVSDVMEIVTKKQVQSFTHDFKEKLKKEIIKISLAQIGMIGLCFFYFHLNKALSSVEGKMAYNLYLFIFIIFSSCYLGVLLYHFFNYRLMKTAEKNLSKNTESLITQLRKKGKRFIIALVAYLFIAFFLVCFCFVELYLVNEIDLLPYFNDFYDSFPLILRIVCYIIFSLIFSFCSIILYKKFLGSYLKKIDVLNESIKQ